ncbi:hypothetical protein [Streptomyces adustus]
MPDLSPSSRDASRSSDSAAADAVDLDRMSDALLKLEHSGRTRRAWESTRRLLAEGMRNLARLMRRMFRRRSGGGAGDGGYDLPYGPAGAAGQQLSEGSERRRQSDGRPEERQREPGPERQRDRELSSLDQLVRAVGELPPEHRRAFEDTVLEKIRTDDSWLRAYDRDVAAGRDSFLVEYANNAYLREVAPSDGPDPQDAGDEADFTQGPPAYSATPNRGAVNDTTPEPVPDREWVGNRALDLGDTPDLSDAQDHEEAYDGNDTRDRGDADVLIDEPVLDHWDRFLASMERPAGQERDPATPATPASLPSPDSRTNSPDLRTSSPDSRTSSPASPVSPPVSPVSPPLPAATPLPVNPLGQGAELHRPQTAGSTRRTTQGPDRERPVAGSPQLPGGNRARPGRRR